ncbi:hypothetical protein B0H10DRAFT_2211390 [Mycena sp. CBHHK59/15]|nr:hypothetical protein B0H10DRAFT_2211390 [Mycena sp. CBHHK59/15]
MSDVTSLQASLAQLVLESNLYGILLILFVSTIYFLAVRRTLASDRQTTKHHFTSLVFFGVAGLFLSTTTHWIARICQTFLAFTDVDGAVTRQAFYAIQLKKATSW